MKILYICKCLSYYMYSNCIFSDIYGSLCNLLYLCKRISLMLIIVMFWYIFFPMFAQSDSLDMWYFLLYIWKMLSVIKIDFCINLLIFLNRYSYLFNMMILMSKYGSRIVEIRVNSFRVSILLFKFPLANLYNTLVHVLGWKYISGLKFLIYAIFETCTSKWETFAVSIHVISFCVFSLTKEARPFIYQNTGSSLNLEDFFFYVITCS